MQPRKPEIVGNASRPGPLEFYIGLERDAMDRLEQDSDWKIWFQLVH